MILHSFGLRFKPWSDYAETIRVEINRQSPNPVDFVDHALVNVREQCTIGSAVADYLSALYADRPPT